MRVDHNTFIKNTCKKCNRYSEKIMFGKCVADKGSVYVCARERLFNRGKFNESRGLNDK